ncbi:hypothetical protein L3Q82_000691 [Scortum barcoo]|uniref:Uncharacterized protein n=1 Tax=Scortum barcoo TaxID=214431 RepID=A0ACB8WDG4_9TELE|nr:hypothetical protein L3Q82_000691 [Scortum barcoo]
MWPSDAVPALQDCFQRTDWQIFREAAVREGEVDLEDYTSAVLGYISKCTEDVTSTRTVTEYPNQKPWLNAEVRSLLKARDAAFRSGDRLALRAARRQLTAGVKRAKTAYAQRIPGTLHVQRSKEQTAVCEDPRRLLLLHHPQHRLPPGLCAEPPLLFTLLTHDCSAIHPSCLIVKFADDTAVVGRIANNDESDYRQEVEHLEGWCRQNNLCINVKKTKEMIVDFRRGRHLPSPLYIGGTAVEVVSSFRYLGVHISDDLTWSKNTSCLIRKAHQRLYFLRRLRRAGLGSSVLTSFYRCVVESVLSSCIIVWHGSCSAAEKKALQRVVKAAQRTVGRSLPTTTDMTSTPPDAGNGPPAS